MEKQQLNPKIESQQQKGSPQQPGPPQPPWRAARIWLLIPIILIVWNVIALWPKAHTDVSIPYTAFLAQVRTSNVAKVHIVGDQIIGSFEKPVPWPRSKEETTATVPTDPKTAPTTKPPSARSVPAPPPIYSEFQTTFPSEIGDPNLISILEAHKVVVDVSRPSSPW
ncbi:MAG: ATP-dependent metallopeptidase FtsH/Yme1/Tma family protein, partial [Candidatus Binatia bacterium]